MILEHLGRDFVRSYGSGTEGVLTPDSPPVSLCICHEANNLCLLCGPTMTFQGNWDK